MCEKKILVCHDGASKCISKNALQAHINHGDFVGPCVSCNGLSPRSNRGNINEVNVYPNPAIEQVFITTDFSISSQLSIKLINQLGQEVFHCDFKSDQVLKINTDLANIAPGNYFVIIYSETDSYLRRLVIANQTLNHLFN